MNLHRVSFPLTNVGLWLTVWGRNGRNIGTHIWRVLEGEPPPFDSSHRQTYNRNYWSPPRFSWQPFQYADLVRRGYTPPLCGRRSASTNPRIGEGYENERCERCSLLAAQSGIIPLTYRQAMESSTLYPALMHEREEWMAAGRPAEWPLPSPQT